MGNDGIKDFAVMICAAFCPEVDLRSLLKAIVFKTTAFKTLYEVNEHSLNSFLCKGRAKAVN